MEKEKAIAIEKDYQVREVKVSGLKAHMILGQEVRSGKGLLLISKGQELDSLMLKRLRYYNQNSRIQEPIRVLVPVGVHNSRPIANEKAV